MFRVSIPTLRSVESRWVYEFIFGGDSRFVCQESNWNSEQFIIESDGKTLTLANCLLSISAEKWLSPSSLPSQTPSYWNNYLSPILSDSSALALPVLFGSPEVTISETGIACEIDIFGLVFFVLSRYEEIVIREKDRHARFPGRASIMLKAGLIQRPIVDEYVRILWDLLGHIWPNLTQVKREGSVRVSCDIDHLFDPSVRNARTILKRITQDVVHNRDGRTALSRIRRYVYNSFGNYRYDSFYTYEWYMETCEQF